MSNPKLVEGASTYNNIAWLSSIITTIAIVFAFTYRQTEYYLPIAIICILNFGYIIAIVRNAHLLEKGGYKRSNSYNAHATANMFISTMSLLLIITALNVKNVVIFTLIVASLALILITNRIVGNKIKARFTKLWHKERKIRIRNDTKELKSELRHVYDNYRQTIGPVPQFLSDNYHTVLVSDNDDKIENVISIFNGFVLLHNWHKELEPSAKSS